MHKAAKPQSWPCPLSGWRVSCILKCQLVLELSGHSGHPVQTCHPVDTKTSWCCWPLFYIQKHIVTNNFLVWWFLILWGFIYLSPNGGVCSAPFSVLMFDCCLLHWVAYFTNSMTASLSRLSIFFSLFYWWVLFDSSSLCVTANV